jgi:hypothetical protein
MNRIHLSSTERTKRKKSTESECPAPPFYPLSFIVIFPCRTRQGRLVTSRHRNGSSRVSPSASSSRSPSAGRESSIAGRDDGSSSASGLRTPVAPVAAPVSPPETVVAALTSTFESLLKRLGDGAGGCGTLAGNPACGKAGGEGTGGLRPASGHREAASRHWETTGGHGEAGRTGRMREGPCRARVPAEVRKSSSEVEEEGKSRDDER